MRHGPLFRMLIPEQRTMPQYRKKERILLPSTGFRQTEGTEKKKGLQ